jgi:aconitate hydratase
MGQAPATGRNSLRTVPRNFPGRSGTKEDSVFLCSPEVATASALTGKITDPRDLEMTYPKVKKIKKKVLNKEIMQAPLPESESKHIKLIKGPNVKSLPELKPLLDHLELIVLLKTGNNISTDDILPAGVRVLPYRSNIPKISEFAFDRIDETYAARAKEARDNGKQHAIIGGENYGQGSSREHAALAPRFLGLQLVIAISFARIHWENLINFGVLPLTFSNAEDYKKVEPNDVIVITDVFKQIQPGKQVKATIADKKLEIILDHRFSQRQVEILKAGGLINFVKRSM